MLRTALNSARSPAHPDSATDLCTGCIIARLAVFGSYSLAPCPGRRRHQCGQLIKTHARPLSGLGRAGASQAGSLQVMPAGAFVSLSVWDSSCSWQPCRWSRWRLRPCACPSMALASMSRSTRSGKRVVRPKVSPEEKPVAFACRPARAWSA